TGMLGASGSLAQGFGGRFSAPSLAGLQLDPGYQFRLDQGLKALQNSAAAKGGIFSGNTAQALNDYAQNSASNEYMNAYNRARDVFGTNYNIFQNNQANLFNRLSALAGGGQVAAQNLGGNQLSAANAMANTTGMIGNDIMNAGAARGSGYVGSANALSGMFNNLGNLGMLYGMMNQSNSNPYGPMYPGSDSWMLGPR